MNVIEYHPAPIANYLKHEYKLAEQRYSTGCIYKENTSTSIMRE